MQVQLLLDRDIQGVIKRFEAMPFVTKVVPGSFSQSPHAFKAGDVKVVRKSGHGVDVRAYSAKGMANIYLYGDPEELAAALTPPAKEKPSKLVRAKAARPEMPTTSRITRAGRQQPVYPEHPAVMKAAEPVATGVSGQLVRVTPAIAINWLERNTRNRRLRDVDVAKYAADMKAGRWFAGGAIIKFDVNLNIVNGQHVLWAVTESQCEVDVFVLHGLDPDVVLVEDDHARRTLTDAIHILSPGRSISSKHTSCATMLRHSMEWALGRPISFESIPRQAQVAYLDEHRAAIEFAVSVMNGAGRGVNIAPVSSVIARAFYTVHHDTLRQFARVVSTGLVTSTNENTAILLRNWLLQANGSTSNTMLSRQDAYRRTERALKAYIDTEQLKILKPITEELFPLPTEKPRKR